MVIVLNRVGHRGIVVVPLLSVDFPHVVPIVEVLQKQRKHLLLAHLCANHLRVLRAVVHLSNFSYVYFPSTFLVKFQKRLVNDGLASRVGLAPDRGEELGEVDHTIMVLFEKS